MSAPSLIPSALLRSLRVHEQLAGPRRFVVAFSGGLDSTVLLDLCRRSLPQVPGAQLQAVHVDHGLHPDSSRWAEHCMRVATELGVGCRVRLIDGRPRPGESPEAAARKARYEALLLDLQPDDVLLTAHHCDDQLETVLLQLLRGGGLAAGAGMAALYRRQVAWHWRPLLAHRRSALRAYARGADLQWLDDPANTIMSYDRNYVRHAVVPVLQHRWPAAAANVARFARHSRSALALTEELAAQDYATVCDTHGRIDVSALTNWSQPRQANLLRHWLASRQLATPSTVQMDRCLQDLIGAAYDRQGCVQWPGVQMRRFRHHLYAMAPLAEVPADFAAILSPDQPVVLPGELGRLRAERVPGTGLSQPKCAAGIDVRFRSGGEKIAPTGGQHTRQLRNLYQESAVVPWMRNRIPLIYVAGVLAGVADLWISRAFAADNAEPGLRLVWEEHPPLY